MAMGVMAVAYMGLAQKRVFNSEPIGHFEEQVFRENELRLTDLAAYLNIGHHALSQVINEQYKVNSLRLCASAVYYYLTPCRFSLLP